MFSPINYTKVRDVATANMINPTIWINRPARLKTRAHNSPVNPKKSTCSFPLASEQYDGKHEMGRERDVKCNGLESSGWKETWVK